MRKTLTGSVAVGLLLLASACSDDGESSSPVEGEVRTDTPPGDDYPDEARDSFMDVCTGVEGLGGVELGGLSEAECLCQWSAITAHIPYEEWAAYGQAVRDGDSERLDELPQELPQEATDAMEAC